MAGFNLPITQYTPAQLAEMARQAFKPPALMGGGGGGGGGMGALPQSPGFNLGQGMAGAGQGLGALAGQLGKLGGSGQPETAAVGPGGLSGAVSGINALQPGADGVWAQPPMPTDIGYGQGGGFMGSLFGGGLADGGPVTPGKYYTVGEQGPETFVPDVPGRIVPADQLMPAYREPDRPIPADQLMPMYREPGRPIPADQLMPAYRGTRDFFGGPARR